MKKIHPSYFLLVLLLVAFCLRVYHLHTDLLFHRDQGLHSLAIYHLWHDHQLSLLGHPSDVDGLYHAPIYYWLMLPAYALSGGSPVAASVFQICLEVLSLPFLYLAIKKLFNQPTARLTIILYTFSYGLISLSRWLVNVTPIIPFTNILLYLLTLNQVKKQSTQHIFLVALIVGCSAQFNAAIGTFIFPFLFWFYRSRLKSFISPLLLLGFFLPASPLLLFELRHHFVISHSLLNFSGSGAGLGISLRVLLKNFSTYLREVNKITAYPYSLLSSTLLISGLVLLYQQKPKPWLLGYLLIPFLGLSLFQRGAIGFFFVAILPVSLAIIAFTLTRFTPKLRFILVIFLLFLNLKNLPLVYRPTNALIPIGDANLITLQDRKNIIDWLYSQSHHEPFSVWFYTLPYYQTEVWQYTFLYYALPKYGYLPEKIDNFSPNDLSTSKHFFAVWEPDQANPNKQTAWFQEIVTNFSPADNSYHSHDLFTQHHLLNP